MAGSGSASRRRAVQAARGACLAVHCAAGLSVGCLTAERLLRSAEGLVRAAIATMGGEAAEAGSEQVAVAKVPSPVAAQGQGVSRSARRRRRRRAAVVSGLAVAGEGAVAPEGSTAGVAPEVSEVGVRHSVEGEPAASAAAVPSRGASVASLPVSAAAAVGDPGAVLRGRVAGGGSDVGSVLSQGSVHRFVERGPLPPAPPPPTGCEDMVVPRVSVHQALRFYPGSGAGHRGPG